MVELPDTWRCIWCERLLLTQDTDTCDECGLSPRTMQALIWIVKRGSAE